MTSAPHPRGRHQGGERRPWPLPFNALRVRVVPGLVWMLLVALLAGCTSSATSETAPTVHASAPVGAVSGVDVSPAHGGTVSTNGATLIVPNGAVKADTVAHLKPSSNSILQQILGGSRDRTAIMQPVGTPVDVDLSGQQPVRPLTLTFPVVAPGLGDHPTLAVLTEHQGVTSVLRGTLSGDHRTYTVSVPRLSLFQLVSVNADRLFETVTAGLQVAAGTLTITDTKPSCVGQLATLPDGSRVGVTGAQGPVWPCVTTEGENVRVTVHVSDSLPWQVRSHVGQYAGPTDTETKAFLVQEIYKDLATNRPYADGLVLPQSEGQWTISGNQLPTRMSAKVSIGAWLAATAVFAVFYGADVASAGQAGGTAAKLAERLHTITDKTDGWDCLLRAAHSVPDGVTPTTQQITNLFQAVAGCTPTLLKQLFGASLGGLRTLSLDIIDGGGALVWAGFDGALRTAFGMDTTTWLVVRTGAAVPDTGSCERTLPTYPVLLPGASGPPVRTLQCLLNDAGLGPVVVDGQYGPQTRTAIDGIAHEGPGPLTRDGRVNNAIWVLIISFTLGDRTLQQGATGPKVTTLQRALRAAGATLAVDGVFGRQTATAVKEFQRSNHLIADGIVGPETLFYLGGAWRS